MVKDIAGNDADGNFSTVNLVWSEEKAVLCAVSSQNVSKGCFIS